MNDSITRKWIMPLGFVLVAIAVQVLLVNPLYLWGWCFPYVYIVALICLPVIPRWAEILIGAAAGFLMDVCCSSAGMHTSACVLLSFLRPMLLTGMVQETERITGAVMMLSIGVSQFVRLALILCLLHHAVVFFLDAWSMPLLGITAIRWIISSAVSLAFILLYGRLRTL